MARGVVVVVGAPVLVVVVVLLLSGGPSSCRAQYEKYSFRGFPEAELMPLRSAYAYALEQYEGEAWKESVRYLEASLRLHRLLRDSEAHCHKECAAAAAPPPPPPTTTPQHPKAAAAAGEEEDPAGGAQAGHGGGGEVPTTTTTTTTTVPTTSPDAEEELRELELFGLLLRRASCLRRCKRALPAFQLSYPPGETLRDFQRRIPYQYLHYALFKANKVEKAVSAAHTFLQKNPKHEMTQKYLNYYKTMVDVDEYLVDLEAQPYETVFVRAVKLYNSGDFRNSVADMEHALSDYYESYENCLAGCEGSYELLEFKDFYPAIADHFLHVLQCKVDCEAELTPNVGGYFVEKFVATMYHYLQFAYYKLNDIKNAVQSVASYMLFDPGDEVMQQNLAYYRFHRERWHLEDDDFNPRQEALHYHNRTSMQTNLLEFARLYLQPDDEGEVGDGEDATDLELPSDAEFENIGDYEEGFLSQWWQEPRSKGDKADQGY